MAAVESEVRAPGFLAGRRGGGGGGGPEARDSRQVRDSRTSSPLTGGPERRGVGRRGGVEGGDQDETRLSGGREESGEAQPREEVRSRQGIPSEGSGRGGGGGFEERIAALVVDEEKHRSSSSSSHTREMTKVKNGEGEKKKDVPFDGEENPQRKSTAQKSPLCAPVRQTSNPSSSPTSSCKGRLGSLLVVVKIGTSTLLSCTNDGRMNVNLSNLGRFVDTVILTIALVMH